MRKHLMACDVCGVEARHPYNGWFAVQANDLNQAGWLGSIGGPSGDYCSRDCARAAFEGLLDRAVQKRIEREEKRRAEEMAT